MQLTLINQIIDIFTIKLFFCHSEWGYHQQSEEYEVIGQIFCPVGGSPAQNDKLQ